MSFTKEQRLIMREKRLSLLRCIHCMIAFIELEKVIDLPFCCQEHRNEYNKGNESTMLIRYEKKMSLFRMNAIQPKNKNTMGYNHNAKTKHYSCLIEKIDELHIDLMQSIALYNAYENEITHQLQEARFMNLAKNLLEMRIYIVENLWHLSEKLQKFKNEIQSEVINLNIEQELFEESSM